jgi:iron complex outermembrane receptor protein
MVRAPLGWGSLGMAVGWCLMAGPVRSQQPVDTGKVYRLPPVTVSVTRTDLPFSQTPLAVQLLDKSQISRGRPTWGLDESLAAVPGVYVANRYNFSLDQRISIRGFGSRSAFAVRGVKILLDGIPQTLPDGQGQLTNVELGAADRVEVLRGSASALFGNASGGVISIWSDPAAPGRPSAELQVTSGWFDRNGRTWSKWLASASERVAGGGAYVTVSRLNYNGERDHSAADFRNLNAHVQLPLAPSWSLSLLAEAGIDPRADNPGALTLAEMHANRDSTPPINVSTRAGKDVTQLQGGATVRHQLASGGEAAFTVFGLGRTLRNPTTFAYIDLDRSDYGVRAQVAKPLALGRFRHRLTAGFDFQRQRDDRVNYNNAGGQPVVDSVQLDQLEHVTEVGPFVQSAVELNPRTTVTAGLRYDWVDFRVADRLVAADSLTVDKDHNDSGRRLMAALSGSLGVALNPAPAVTLYANIGSSFETPTTTELTNRPDTAGGFNPTLQPQKAWNYEVGARGALDGRVSYSVALYQADVRGELIPYGVPGSPQRVFYQNAGSARHRGVELGLDAHVLAGVDLGGAWTHSDFRYVRYTVATFVLDGRTLPGVPADWLRLTVRVRPAVARGAWLDYEESYSSGYYVNDTLGVRTSPWWAANLRVGWEGTAGSLRIAPFIGVNNLYNRLYVGSVTINGARGRYYEPAPARNAYVGFSLGAVH